MEERKERMKTSTVLGLSITVYIFAVVMSIFVASILASYMGNNQDVYLNLQSIIAAVIVVPLVYRLLKDGSLWHIGKRDPAGNLDWITIIKYAAIGMLLIYGIGWMMEYGFAVLGLNDHESVDRLNALNDRGGGSNFLLQLLGSAVAPALCEELLIRGAIFGALRAKRGFLFSAIISSGIFGILHDLGLYAVFGFLMGMVLCLVMELTGGLAAPILLHFCNNLLAVIASMQGVESGFGTSGFDNMALNWLVFLAILAGVVIVTWRLVKNLK